MQTSVGESMKFWYGKPDAGDLHVRFDERGVETEHDHASEAPQTEKPGHRYAAI